MSGPTPRDHRIIALAEKTADAFSAPAFSSWPAVIRVLADRRLDDRQIEAIVRSKLTRWARDEFNGAGKCPAHYVARYYDDLRNFGGTKADRARWVQRMVDDTFPPDEEVEYTPEEAITEAIGELELALKEPYRRSSMAARIKTAISHLENAQIAGCR